VVIDSALLERILDRDELVPCFQPLVELRTGHLCGFELLARWQHPDLGLILPGTLIQVAEKRGMVTRLMQQVLRKALVSGPVLPGRLSIAVNVSPVQLRDLSLPKEICKLAMNADFPLDRLAIEITETALMDNHGRALAITQELKAMGCKLVLDDFGTGYSSFRHLQALPFDELKIDGSFVSQITATRESRKIVAALIGLGQSLGMVTVAEGIETEEQANMLLWLGCDIGQGWLYGKAEPAAMIPEMVKAVAQRPPMKWSAQEEDEGMSNLEGLPAQRLAQLQAIYDGAPVGLCFLNRDLRYVSINRRLATMNGRPALAHIGRTVQEVLPQLFPFIQPYLARALCGEAMSEIELTRSLANGKKATLVVSYEPAWDEAGEVIGVSIALADITQRKREEQARLESEERYRAMVDLNPQVPWILDGDGNIVDVSTRWQELTGLSREQSLNHGWLEVIHPDDLEATKAMVEKALQTGEPIDFEYRVRQCAGNYIWMRTRGTAQRDAEGKVLRYYGSVEDINERKQMEEELRLWRELLRKHESVVS
jgi:PAS domain S-box-containing protein